MDTHVKIALQCALSAHIMLCVDCPSLLCLLSQFVVRVIAVLALILCSCLQLCLLPCWLIVRRTSRKPHHQQHLRVQVGAKRLTSRLQYVVRARVWCTALAVIWHPSPQHTRLPALCSLCHLPSHFAEIYSMSSVVIAETAAWRIGDLVRFVWDPLSLVRV
jgi:uncharacterized membrane protein